MIGLAATRVWTARVEIFRRIEFRVPATCLGLSLAISAACAFWQGANAKRSDTHRELARGALSALFSSGITHLPLRLALIRLRPHPGTSTKALLTHLLQHRKEGQSEGQETDPRHATRRTRRRRC